MAHGHFWGWMSLARGKPFSQLACRDVAIFTSLIIDELTPKSGHEPNTIGMYILALPGSMSIYKTLMKKARWGAAP